MYDFVILGAVFGLRAPPRGCRKIRAQKTGAHPAGKV